LQILSAESLARSESVRVLYLPALALGLLEVLVVGHFQHDRRDDFAEEHAQLVGSRVRVLDGVVQQRCAQHRDVIDAFALEQAREGDRMVDVGRSRGVLAALVAMLFGREGHGFQQQRLRVDVHGMQEWRR
jgi:hypothetical protein